MSKHYQFSAPGRTEIGGNHTDHQHGCVLAAAVNLETLADVSLNESDMIWVQSEGYPAFGVDLTDLSVHEEEKNTTAALSGVWQRHSLGAVPNFRVSIWQLPLPFCLVPVLAPPQLLRCW